MKKFLLVITGIVVAAAVFMNLVLQKQRADLLIINGNVYTVDAANSKAEAIAVRGSRIVAVGTTQDIQKQYTSQNVIDVEGKTVIPGLIDGHAHMLGLGEALSELNLVGTASAEAIASMVAEKARELQPGEWIRGRGWDQNDWGSGTGEKPFPTSAVLDKAAPNNPVILSRIDGHAIWVNSKAMSMASASNDFPKEVEGGSVIRNGVGKPTGIFVDNASSFIWSVVPGYTKEEKIRMYTKAFDECLKYGVTGVHDMGIDETDFDIYKEFAAWDNLPVRIYGLIGGSGKFLSAMLASGPYIDGIHYRLAVRGIKLYMDGALGSRGAALIEPYSDEPENRGLLMQSPDTIRIVTETALSKGFQVCVHAIGDRANKLVLDEFEKAAEQYPLKAHDARLRIEHAQVIAPDDIPRFKKLNVIPSMQPVHATSDMYWAQARLGPDRILGAYAWRSLADDGNIIVSGSDFPVEHPNPLLGFYAAVTRQDADGIPRTADDVRTRFQLSADGIRDPKHFENGWYAEQKLTREEALRSFTIWAAFAEFTSNQKGSLEEGKLADIVVLSKDIMTVEPKEILTTAVEMTIVGGSIRYRQSAGTRAGGR
jgi:predicted amidohydrolase YtcJ